MKVLKNYWQTILLLLGMLVGGAIGILNPEFALNLKHLIQLNLSYHMKIIDSF